MRPNGPTSAGKQRWRCTNCNATSLNTRANTDEIRHFTIFIEWILTGDPAHRVAARYNVSRRTLTRWFRYFWFIQIPSITDPHRVYDQLFIDGTYFHKKCLLVACTSTHVVAWHWCIRETTRDYTTLLDKLAPPLVVTTDGQRGSLKAIKDCWPHTKIQRCLVHVQRNIYTETTRNPHTAAGKVLRRLADDLTGLTDNELADSWINSFNKFSLTFHDWINQRTYRKDVAETDIPKRIRPNQQWWYTHPRHRRAYKLLKRLLVTEQTLLTYLNPPEGCQALKSTTNYLEGGINKQLKDLASDHRGMFDEHQRIAMDWWLYHHTEHHQPALQLAKDQYFGLTGYNKAKQLYAEEQQRHQPHPTGKPATYDTSIDTDFNPSWAIRHGWAGRG